MAKLRIVTQGYVHEVDDLKALAVAEKPPPTVVPGGATDAEREKWRRSAVPSLALEDWKKK